MLGTKWELEGGCCFRGFRGPTWPPPRALLKASHSWKYRALSRGHRHGWGRAEVIGRGRLWSPGGKHQARQLPRDKENGTKGGCEGFR